MSEVVKLTSELIARPSLTPDDAGCQPLIAERLAKCGFEVEWFYCGDVSNVLLTRGSRQPSLWFLGHTDVVPPGPPEDWSSPPFEPEIRDGVIYGRGAADMKGAVAAMVVALEQFAEHHPQHAGQAGLLLTSDEEGVALDGIRAVAGVLAQRGGAPDYCVVGEPSSQDVFGDTVRIGRRGSIAARLAVHGVQGHTAFPHQIDNPVHRLAPFLAELVATRWDDGDEHFPPSHCQVSGFKAGTGAVNVTPGHAELLISLRNSPLSPQRELRQRVEAMLDRHGVKNYDLDWHVSGEPFRSNAGALRKALDEVLREHLHAAPDWNTGGGTSDGRFIAPLGTEVLEIGLLNTTIHKVDECTPVEDLDRLSRIYLDLMIRLLC
jgi:succinyl-diaminopimelate desuccinylase